MCACREYRHWSPVGVVSGIGDELIIERQRAPFVDVIGIISLNNFLFAVVQMAISNQQANAAGREEVAVGIGKTIDDATKTDGVIVSPPRDTPDRYAGRHAAIDIGEGQDFGLAVVPACASEDADVPGDRLLHVCVGTL